MIVRRTLIIAVVIAIGLPILLFFSMQGQAVEQQQEELSNVQVYRVSVGDVRTAVEASGQIESDNEIALSFMSGGRIKDLYVQEGDYVLEGSILAVLENDMQQIAYQQAYLNVNRAELMRYNTLNIDEDQLEIASQQLSAAWTALGNADNAVSDADMMAMQAQYDELMEQANYIQTQANQAPGGYGSDNYNTLQAQAGEAAFNAELARLNMQSAVESKQPGVNAAYGNVLNAQAELEVLLAGPNEYARDRADLQVEQSLLDLSHATQDYADTYLVAPHDGIVSSLNKETGALVNPGGQVLQLTDINNLNVTIFVDEIDIGDIENGMEVRFLADALAGMEFTGTVTQVAPRSTIRDGVVVFEVELNVNDPEALLRVGMTTDAEIELEEVENTILVPSSFVSRTNGQATVVVLNEDGTRQERVVTIGLRGQTNTEILSGVTSGELIVVENFDFGSSSPFGG